LRFRLPYGRHREVTLEVPNENAYFVVDRGETPALKNLGETTKRALRNPVGTSPLSEMVHRGDRVVVVGDDITRPTPQKAIVPVLLDELNAVGIPDGDIELVVALGTHREMSERELKEKYGAEVVERVSVKNHNHKDPEGLVNLGKTGAGIPITLNRDVFEADFVVGVGNIIPHCYTGWGGGGKIIQPGVCGEEITASTHLMAGKFRPISKLAGDVNHPVRRMVDAVALKAGLNLIVNTVLNRDEEVSRLVVGHPVEAFMEGVRAAEETYCPKVPGYADVVVVSTYPADIDYWQAVKALVYAHVAVKPGGTVVFITPCPEGVSPVHPLLREGGTWGYDKTLEAVEKGEVEDLIAAAPILIHSQVLERAEVVCYSDGLTEGDKEALGFMHASTPQEALEMALERQGRSAKVGVLKCGEVLPIVG